MFDLPLHPILVHFPLVLTVLIPIFASVALVLGLRNGKARKYWAVVILFQILLVGSSFLAVQTGERDEEKVEKVLASEAPLETHEEKGELFLKASGAALALLVAGLATGPVGLFGRSLGAVASLVVLVLGFQVGHSGGALIYRHGAAAAFTTDNREGAGTNRAAPLEAEGGPEEKEEISGQ